MNLKEKFDIKLSHDLLLLLLWPEFCLLEIINVIISMDGGTKDQLRHRDK